MTRQELFNQIKQKKSFLCIGLDTDKTKLPKHLLKLEDPVAEFNRQIIAATHDLCVAYKPNLAFYEADGVAGMQSLEKTMRYLPETCFSIADAKRGDIGNTSAMYARSFFDHYGFDSVTVAPYMGSDSVKPFLGRAGKWVILLALTSNEGAFDFQTQKLKNGKALYEEVLRQSAGWGSAEELMYLVGATKAEFLKEIRQYIPHHFLLVPGVGAQGGSLADVAKYGMNSHCGLLVNASRSILYASSGENFAELARVEAIRMQQEMSQLLDQYLG
ncbi:MAG: orotidine-5'-phosphate decarboxylase [Bacteroidia bacterium]